MFDGQRQRTLLGQSPINSWADTGREETGETADDVAAAELDKRSRLSGIFGEDPEKGKACLLL